MRRFADQATDLDYNQAMGFEPPLLQQAQVGIVQRIRKIMAEETDDNEMLTVLKELYSESPFDKMNAWPATRKFLLDAAQKAGNSNLVIS